MYRILRTVHLLCGMLAVPYLLMYGVSAVQMAHSAWFPMKPNVTERDVALTRAYDNARLLARDLMELTGLEGEIRDVQPATTGFALRIVVPGTVHEIKYDRSANRAHIKTNVAGFMGMLNRLHHAAGLWPEYLPLQVWGVLIGVISLGVLGLGTTGLWMWWLRKQERLLGLILLAANLGFALVILTLIRSTGS